MFEMDRGVQIKSILIKMYLFLVIQSVQTGEGTVRDAPLLLELSALAALPSPGL